MAVEEKCAAKPVEQQAQLLLYRGMIRPVGLVQPGLEIFASHRP
jgi:hypothetical protein